MLVKQNTGGNAAKFFKVLIGYLGTPRNFQDRQGPRRNPKDSQGLPRTPEEQSVPYPKVKDAREVCSIVNGSPDVVAVDGSIVQYGQKVALCCYLHGYRRTLGQTKTGA
jgi:hypothetical protein